MFLQNYQILKLRNANNNFLTGQIKCNRKKIDEQRIIQWVHNNKISLHKECTLIRQLPEKMCTNNTMSIGKTCKTLIWQNYLKSQNNNTVTRDRTYLFSCYTWPAWRVILLPATTPWTKDGPGWSSRVSPLPCFYRNHLHSLSKSFLICIMYLISINNIKYNNTKYIEPESSMRYSQSE